MRTTVTQQEREQVQQGASGSRTSDAEAPRSELAAQACASPALSVQRQMAELAANSPRQEAQRELAERINARTGERRPDGLPRQLKSGIEQLSGMSMDGVRVHYNSPRPAQLGALAYAQGSDIHLAAGQERHLPHEAWHVVQQAQGRVKPTMQMKDGTPVNDAMDMEREADVMGARAATLAVSERPVARQAFSPVSAAPVQRIELTKKMRTALRQWVPTKIDSKSDEYGAIVEWFEEATQLAASDFNWIITKPFLAWYEHGSGYANMNPASVTSEAFQTIGAPAAASAKPADPLAAVRKKVKSAGLRPSDFSTLELETIQAGSSSGWAEAIRSVNEQRLARIESARLIAERTVKYGAAKVLGDQAFPAGLIRDVWNLSHSIAVSGNASANTTLAQAHSDAAINTAAQAWHAQAELRPPGNALAPQAEAVTNFHVPGAPVYIEDKSRRLVNPDPTRGRQADFICHWGAVNVNVHVDSTQKH